MATFGFSIRQSSKAQILPQFGKKLFDFEALSEQETAIDFQKVNLTLRLFAVEGFRSATKKETYEISKEIVFGKTVGLRFSCVILRFCST